MTTSRIVRGTKIRIFLSFCAVVAILGLLACYNNTITQLSETEKAVEVCHQQQENLSTQLQVISDYKFRLEKALKTEKAEHLKSNASFSEAVKDERDKTAKATEDAQMRFDSIQQKYNLLQIEYDDFKEKNSKSREDRQKEFEELQNKLKEMEENFREVKQSKENLKSEVVNLQLENDRLKTQIEDHASNVMGNENKTNYLQKQNIELKIELDKLKDKCGSPRVQETIAVLNEPQKQDQNVLVMPNIDDKNNVKSSSTAKIIVSKGSLNGARPLALPTLTPKQKKQENAVPEGVLPIPNNNLDVAAQQADSKPETQNEIIDNRYKNQIAEEQSLRKKEEIEKENTANEVLDPNFISDGIGFGDPIKQAERSNFGKNHIDALKIVVNKEGDNGAGADYRMHDQMEDNNGIDEGEDDDQDEYADHLARRKEVEVRN